MLPSTPTRMSTLRRRQAALTAAAGTVLMLSLSPNLAVAAQPPPRTAVRPAAATVNLLNNTAQHKSTPATVEQLQLHPAGLPHDSVRPSPRNALQTPHQPQQQNVGPKEYPQPVTELRSTRRVDPASSTKQPVVRPKHLDPLGNRIPRTAPGDAVGSNSGDDHGRNTLPGHPTRRTPWKPPMPGASALNPKPQVNNRLAGKPLLTSHHSTSMGASSLPQNALPVPRPDADMQPDRFVPRSGNDSASVADALRNPLPNFTHRGLEQLPVVQTPVLPEGTEFKQTDGQSREPRPPEPSYWIVFPVGDDGDYSAPVPAEGGNLYWTEDGRHYAWKPIVKALLRAEALNAYLNGLPREAFQDDRLRDDLNAVQRELITLEANLRTLTPEAMAYAAELAIRQKAKDAHGDTPSSGGTVQEPGAGFGIGGAQGGRQNSRFAHGQQNTTTGGGVTVFDPNQSGSPGGGGNNQGAAGANQKSDGKGNDSQSGAGEEYYPDGGDGGGTDGHGPPDRSQGKRDSGKKQGTSGGNGRCGYFDTPTIVNGRSVLQCRDDDEGSNDSDNDDQGLAPDDGSGGGGSDVGPRIRKLPHYRPSGDQTALSPTDTESVLPTTTGAGDEERAQVGERGNAAATHGNNDLGQDLRGRINNGTGGATVEGVISQLWWQRNAPRAQPPK